MEIPESLRGLAVCDVPTAGRVLSIGRNQAYSAVKRGDIPTLRIGNRILVPVPALLKLLGYDH